MKCDHCQGFGRLAITNHPLPTYRLVPCPDCNGSGITSCCGDDIAQPVRDENAEIEREIAERTWGDKT